MTWKIKSDDPLAPRADGVFDTARISAEELARIEEEVDKALAACDAAGDRKVLLFLGIGVGNPDLAYGNNSVGLKFAAETQISPGVLRDAAGRGFLVIGLNFNTASTPAPPALSGDSVHRHVPVRFPLTNAGDTNTAALEKVRTLVNRANRLLVLNAVSETVYSTLVDLVRKRSTKKLVGAEECLPCVYAVSYAQTGTSYLAAPHPGIQRCALVNDGGTMNTLEEVFPSLEVLEQ